MRTTFALNFRNLRLYALALILPVAPENSLAQSFSWPIDTHPIGQYYAAYNNGAASKYHTGMDIGDGNYLYTTTVKAVRAGVVHKIFGLYSLPAASNLRRWNSSGGAYTWDAQPTTDRLGQSYGSDNHGLGICVILYHSDLRIYTVYGHLDAVTAGLAPGQNVSAGGAIGKMGNSYKQYLRRSPTAAGTPPTPQGSPPPGYAWSSLIIAQSGGFAPHVHLEAKDRGTISARRTDDEGPDWGYTPGPSPGSIEKPGHPNFFGYHDPNIFLNETVTKISQPVAVELLGALNIRDYPSTSSSLSLVITEAAARTDGRLTAFVSTRKVGGQWYQVFLPNASTEGWSASGWVAGNLSGTIYSRENSALAQVEVSSESARIYASASTGSSTLGFAYGPNLLDEQRFVPFESPAGWYHIYSPQKLTQRDGWILSSAVTYISGSDTTPPTVTINQAAGQSDPTGSSPINFTVVFSETVTGFGSGDVTLGGTAGANSKSVTGSGTTYNVAVSGMSQGGTVTATVPAGGAQDAAGNDNVASTSTDNSVTYNAPDTTSPTVTINQTTGQSDPTGSSPINFTVVFSEAVTGFGSADVTLGGTAGANSKSVTGSGTTYNVAVSGMSQGGTVTATVPAGGAQDSAGNGNLASTSTDNSVTYNAPDTTSPTVTINQATGQSDPTGSSPINFTVVFSETVTGFGNSDVTLGGTAGASSKTVTGSGTTYNVAVSGMTQSGTVTATIPAGGAQDAAGNGNVASTSTDNSVTYMQATGYPGATYVGPAGSGNFAFGRNGNSISYIILHTLEGTASAAINYFQTPGAGVSSHYIVGTDGTVWQLVSDTDTAYHAGNLSYNYQSIAIELEGWADGNPDFSWQSNAQLASLANLINWLATQHSIPKDRSRILGHNQIPSPGGGGNPPTTQWGGASNHHDPGAWFNWRSLMTALGRVPSYTAIQVQSATSVLTLPQAGAPVVTPATVGQKFAAYDSQAGYYLVFLSGTNLSQQYLSGRESHWDGWIPAASVSVLSGSAQLEVGGVFPGRLNIRNAAGTSGTTVIARTIDGKRYVPTGNTANADGFTWREFYIATTNNAVATGWAIADNLTVIGGDTTAPTVTINEATGQSDPTGSSPINFTVVFSETVTGFGNSDVTLGGTAGANSKSVTGSGTTYNVAVSGMTQSGTVTAAVPAGAVQDAAGNGNLASTSTDNSVTYNAPDTTSPTVTINQATGQSDPTGSSPINFTVVFSETVTGFGSGDVTLGGTAGAASKTVTGSGTTYNVAVSGMTLSGTVTATIPAGGAQDAAGNSNLASTSTDNSVTYNAPDTTPPTVTINQAAGQSDPTSSSPINFTVVFSESVTGFGSSDVTLGGTAGATSKTVTGSGTTYNVAISGMTQSGTVTATVPAGGAQDAAGNANLASTSTDNSVAYNATDTTPPTVAINQGPGQSDPTSSSPINFTVVFSEEVTGFGSGDVTLGGTAAANSKTVTGSGTTYNVAVSGMTQSGTVTATIAAGGAQDAAGNGNLTSTSTDNSVTYNVIVIDYFVALSVSPTDGGTLAGGGFVASGSQHTVTATANQGYTFQNWTENGSVVSTNASYTFTVNGNRDLVANFVTTQACLASLVSPASGATVGVPPTFTWSFSGSCSNKIYITTNPVPEHIVVLSNVFSSGMNTLTVSESRWNTVLSRFGGPQSQYYWTVGDADIQQADPSLYAPWQPFSVVWKRLTGMTISNGVFSLVLNGTVGDRYVVESSSNLVNWLPLSTNTIPAAGWILVTDPGMTNQTRRYYRAVPADTAGTVILQPGPSDSKDIWTTSYYSYAACAGPGTGGGQNNEHLRVGGWGDQYYSLLQFDLAALPPSASSAVLYLYCYNQSGGGTTMYLDRTTQAWDWRTSGTGCDRDRLWWADRPPNTLWRADPIGTPTVGQWYAVDITDLYNAWKSGTYPNYGLQFRPVNFNANEFNDFYSADYTDNPMLRPKLIATPSN